MREIWEIIERWLGRAHLAYWFVGDGILSSVAGAMSGWWVQITGGSWPGIILAGIGAFVVVFLIVILLIAAARRFWGREDAITFVPIHEIIGYVRQRIGDNNAIKFWPDARLTLRQAALDGRIHLHGHKSEDTGSTQSTSWSKVRTPISQSYWELADIEVMATQPPSEGEFANHTFPHRLSDNRFTSEKIVYYANLTGSWGEVRKQWR